MSRLRALLVTLAVLATVLFATNASAVIGSIAETRVGNFQKPGGLSLRRPWLLDAEKHQEKSAAFTTNASRRTVVGNSPLDFWDPFGLAANANPPTGEADYSPLGTGVNQSRGTGRKKTLETSRRQVGPPSAATQQFDLLRAEIIRDREGMRDGFVKAAEAQQRFKQEFAVGVVMATPVLGQVFAAAGAMDSTLPAGQRGAYGAAVVLPFFGSVLRGVAGPALRGAASGVDDAARAAGSLGDDAARGVNQAVPAGANLVGAGDDLARAAKWVKPQQGVFDVVVHGSDDAFHVLHNGSWVQVNQRSLATFMRGHGYQGGPVRLLSCSSGACSNGVAQNLANKLGAPVTAPNGTLWIHPNGNLTIGTNPAVNSGSWFTFTPGAP